MMLEALRGVPWEGATAGTENGQAEQRGGMGRHAYRRYARAGKEPLPR